MSTRLFTVMFIGLLTLTPGVMAPAQDNFDRPELQWSQEGRFDFCPQSQGFDYRNAYWLAAISYYSYWNPSYLQQIFTSPYGQPLTLKLTDENGDMKGSTLAYGMGWKGHLAYFTSAALSPRSPKKYGEHHSSYFAAPLPFEACVKKEKVWCFGDTHSGLKSQMEQEACGEHHELAIMDQERLHRVHELALGTTSLTPQERSLAQRDRTRIEEYVTTYEKTRGVDLGLDFTDPQFEDRCQIFMMKEDFIPDVQALWLESPDLIILAFRGTEQDNIIDWTTDFATAFQLNHKFLPFWKRNVHKGYEQSLEVLTPWLQDQIKNLLAEREDANSIPIYITGHSMGGALATLAMTTLLERNHKVSAKEKLNLKDVYTFGAPRVGNLDYAKSFAELNSSDQVGLYRIVNNKDPVTRAPCFSYAHFGTNIQINSPTKDHPNQPLLEIMVNPTAEAYTNCAYGTSLFETLANVKTYARHHFLSSYYDNLILARRELNRSLSNETLEFIRHNDPSNLANNPYLYPSSCANPTSRYTSWPRILEVNYLKLPFTIED